MNTIDSENNSKSEPETHATALELRSDAAATAREDRTSRNPGLPDFSDARWCQTMGINGSHLDITSEWLEHQAIREP